MARLTTSLGLNLGALNPDVLRANITSEVTTGVTSFVQGVLNQVSSLLSFPSVPSLPISPSQPTTIRNFLLRNVNNSVEVTTPNETLSGTLIAVENDYIAMVSSGELFLVRLDKIESAQEL